MATVNKIESMEFGGDTITARTDLKMLYAAMSVPARWSTLREADSTTGYAPSGLTFVVKMIRFFTFDPATNNHIQLGYGDADAGFDGSVPAGAVYAYGLGAGAAGPIANPFSLLASTADNRINNMGFGGIDFTIPDGKFPFLRSNGGLNNYAYVWGVEV